MLINMLFPCQKPNPPYFTGTPSYCLPQFDRAKKTLTLSVSDEPLRAGCVGF